MTPWIEAVGLTRHFGPICAADDIHFSVRRGEVVGFLGPNGAGKTTTMRLLAGFLRPSRGHAGICGVRVGRRPITASRLTGYLPEGAPSYPEMRVAAFLEFVARLHGPPACANLHRIVESIGLEAVLRQRIETLSKGFRRRVGLAAALCHDPPVLILDEPTDGLDPNQKDQIRSLIRTMSATKAIIVSTHILEEVEAVCSRAILIDRGRLVADDTPAALRALSADGRLDTTFRNLTGGVAA